MTLSLVDRRQCCQYSGICHLYLWTGINDLYSHAGESTTSGHAAPGYFKGRNFSSVNILFCRVDTLCLSDELYPVCVYESTSLPLLLCSMWFDNFRQGYADPNIRDVMPKVYSQRNCEHLVLFCWYFPLWKHSREAEQEMQRVIISSFQTTISSGFFIITNYDWLDYWFLFNTKLWFQ